MDVDKNHLKWLCRRGTKELDFLMSSYLSDEYDKATEVEKAAFVELLKYEDTTLYDSLLEARESASPVKTVLQSIVSKKTA